ncbi:unnamed protein product [Rotaria sordida]|uniref:Tetratricopeptide repeat protein n=1 Tax=Rotaria sordida TaxID=392033 RepID=A0A814RG99_9BILA|nr:unnamed protein product [Rotaria sordida]
MQSAQVPITIFKQENEQDRTMNLLNKFAYFIDFWNPLLIDLLLDLPQTDYDQQKAKFIEQCRICYRADKYSLKQIDEFENDYKPHLSIQWYKSNSFVYRLLNKVLRQRNIEGIITLRFFILDLFKQLNQIYYEYIESNIYEDNTIIEVYRGQEMFNTEFDNLKKNLIQGRIVSINSFFSTTRTKTVALEYAGLMSTDHITTNFSSHKKRLLFQIKININHQMQLKRKPFADISQLLYKGKKIKVDEYEVLFMVGSFFRVDEIIENQEIEIPIEEEIIKSTITLVKLTSINEEDKSIPIINDYQILKSTKTIEEKLIRIGNLLIDYSLSIQSLHSKVDAYYKILFDESKIMIATACLTGQAWVALKRGEYKLAIELALKALSMNNKFNNELKITTLNCLGGIYHKLKDYPTALKYYKNAYDLSKPTDEKIAENNYHGPCIPIDKYAMYDNYQNISSINIAIIYQKQDEIRLAWNMYKETIDCEMRDTTDFHCHTCMTIAESGTHESMISLEEHNRIWKNWKSFLDLGLIDILKYRTPAITGYLSLSHQYDFPSRRYNNDYCRTMAIDYFRQVENKCTPYVANHQYYLYILQCYERLADLYGYWNTRSTEYYEKMIQLCLKYCSDDLENLIIAYQGILKTFKEQQRRGTNISEDISLLLCANTTNAEFIEMTPPVTPMTSPITPFTPPMFGSLFQNIRRLHFAFGCNDKWIDPRLKTERDLRKKIIYCYMKLANLYYEQKKIIEAKDLLTEIISLCQQFDSEMLDMTNICYENLSFINENFDFIIQSYKNQLSTIINTVGNCINEDIYCYIAQLYERKNDFNSALEFLQIPIQYFEQYNYVCIHTIDCYIKLAKHYQNIRNNKELTVHVYENAINLIRRHRSYPMTSMISIVKEHLVDYFNTINDLDTMIIIYEKLCEIVQQETTDITVLYNRFKQILKLLVKKYDAFIVVLKAYDAYLDLILQIISPLTSQMTVVFTHFRYHFVNAYKESNMICSTIEIYQKLICLLLKHQYNTMKIINEYKIIGAGFTKKHLLKDSVIAYGLLLNFICQYHSTGGFIENDLIKFVFYIWESEIIGKYLMVKDFDAAINLYCEMIHFLKEYCTNVNRNYDLNAFVSNILKNYDEIIKIYQLMNIDLEQIMNIYQKQIEFLAKYRVVTVHEHIKTIISKCRQFATDHKKQAIELYSKLILFIQNNRLNYLTHLAIASNDFVQLSIANDKPEPQHLYFTNQINTNCYSTNQYRIADLQQRILDYKEKAKNYLNNKQLNKAIAVFRDELLPFLLENHAQDDEQIAMCYKQIALLFYRQNEDGVRQALDYYEKVINIYETQNDEFYTEYTFKLNPNICRRYAETLFTCYNSMMEIYIALKNQKLVEMYGQKANYIYEKYRDQFQFSANPITHVITIKRRPMVELNY